ncbi:uncharacterized protein LAESUDRAFT_735996 [Laetiporus sulphureus 93-53]|uniref:Thioester reductase (TE) domain-containing protein n=1 Tax=Laetiporus sulphureus 93-53 TaxID=1314785 RepID=A0A165F624_9APHY|nr:uncharacterized protein LAESUDRAFT_735996 [Laetiporus sulphureus 93-53]KZT08463.1 hypothetical protein LAESUDRAFT_735996 [Laetiporus sulphureus 93-53]
MIPAFTFVTTSLTELVAIRARTSSSYLQVQCAVNRLCAHYATVGLLPPLGENGLPPPRTIAVLTSTVIDESLLEIALAKLGLSPLLFSVNNSVPAITHSTHLIYGSKFVNKAHEARKILVGQGHNVKIVPDKRFPLWGPHGAERASIKSFSAVLQARDEQDRVAVILRSSGSVRCFTHLVMIADVAGFVRKTVFSALPVFHGFGHYNVIKAITVPCPLFFAVHYVIKLLGETEAGVNALAAFESITFPGSRAPNINVIYGTAETGSLIRSTRDFKNDKAWNWLRLQGPIADYLVMEDRGSNTFESVVEDGLPAKIQSHRPDGSYATNDFFLRHPVHSNWYKYIWQLDDMLVQVLGEKTNLVPNELSIRGNSPYVGEAIAFGEGRLQVGCLILPSKLGKDLAKTFMEKVWPGIEDANAQAPTHSRILPEMVYISWRHYALHSYGTTIPQATKMSILLPACYANRLQRASRPKLDLQYRLIFISNAIAQALGADLFAFGVDPLQATRIRNICQNELELNGRTFGQNVVHENPSVEKLAQYIIAIWFDGDAAKSDEDQHATMLAMTERWSARLDLSQKASQNGQEMQLVLLPPISRVICFSRAKSHADSLARLQKSLSIRRLALLSEEWTKVESLAANVNEDRLGLSPDAFLNLLSEVTEVISNAWPVNFKMSLVHCYSAGSTHPVCNENFPSMPFTALGTGYGRIKWVVEKLCERAAQDASISIGVLRVGQLVGDTENHVWNETEAWPLMFKSVKATGVLPRLDDSRSISVVRYPSPLIVWHTEAAMAPDEPSWDTVLAGLKQSGVVFEAMDRTEWLDRLEQSDTDGERTPAIKLLVRDSVQSSTRTRHAEHDFRIHITATALVAQANGSR